MSESDDCKFDWNVIRDFVVEKGNNLLDGIQQNDVDWFLRDSNVSVLEAKQPSQESAEDMSRLTLAASLHTPASPLAATISNTNEIVSSKTKPTISPILEEPVVSDGYHDYARKSVPSSAPRRSSVSSMASMSSVSSNGSANGGGLFAKFKNKFHKGDSQPSSPALAPTTPVFKSDYDIRLSKQVSPTSLSSPVEAPEKPLERCDSDLGNLSDPRLEEFVRFYKREDRPRSSSLSRRGSLRSESVDGGYTPRKASLSEPLAATSKFASFLRRKSSVAPEKDSQSTFSIESPTLSVNSLMSEPLPQFKGLKPMKRVAFHSLTFLIDPPQQIPSRSPRQGNVELLPSGVLRINPLTEADKLAIEKSQRGQGGGLVVGGTGALGLIEKPDTPSPEVTSELPPSKDSNGDDDTKIDQHAKSLGIEKPMLHHRAQPGYTVPVKKMALDLMYTRCCHLREILPIPAIAKQIPKGSMAPLPVLQLRNPTPSMIEIQTFADFIRIAPIICISLDGVSLSFEQFKVLLTAIASKKQLEKLSLRNTPINTEGWSFLCWFLSRNKVINKLDITQCPPLSVNVLKKKKKKPDKKEEEVERMTCNNENRSDMDWALFTATIIARGGVDELILTGCCITDLEIFEKFIKHAVLIKTYKLGMAYNQLTPQQIKILLESWVLTEGSRGLDLGYNDFLSAAYLNVFLELGKNPTFTNLVAKSKLGFISLNATNLSFTEAFKEVIERVFMRLSNLKYLDLSNNPKLFGTYKSLSTSSSDSSSQKSVSDASPSSSPRRSPLEDGNVNVYNQETIISYFSSKLPMFNSLVRLQLENNALTSQSLVVLAQIIPFCKTMGYLSISGNQLDLVSATALTQGLKNSKSLITLDCDYQLLPEVFKERIGLYTMRNMEQILQNLANGHQSNGDGTKEEMSVTEQLSRILLQKAELKLDLKSPEVIKFITRARSDRKKLKTTISELLHLQWKNELNLEGKEALIRLLFIDSSLERGMKLIDPSLVEAEETFSSMDLMGTHLAEDEKNKTGADVNGLDPNSESQGVQAELLTPVESSALPYSRSQSLTNLSNLNREEGSVLKLLNMHKGDNLFDKFHVFSGEEIRQKLLDVNLSELDKVIEYLGKMRKEGVSLKSLFNETPLESDNVHLLDEIRQKLNHLQEVIPRDKDNEPKFIMQPGEAYPVESKIEDGVAINQAYDEVLSKFSVENTH